tara:strand:+ start:74 stop:328 length:255 start_codon:yes stop_codon:yes gene_type:complete
MLTKIKVDNMTQQIDPMTGMPMANPQQQMPANIQGGRPQNFITQPQQQVGQSVFGGQSLPTPLYKMDPNYNGEPGVQQEDFEQF